MESTASSWLCRIALMMLAIGLGTGWPVADAGEEPAGRAVFVAKRCAVCHEERAVLQAPDLKALR